MSKPTISDLTVELGRQPSTDELREALYDRCRTWAVERMSPAELNLPEDRREALITARLKKQGMLAALRDLEDILVLGSGATSLDAPVGRADSTSATLGDLVADRPVDGDDPFAAVERAELRDAILRVIATLDRREQSILLHRYGWLDGEVWTYGKIAAKWDITAERIRQLERAVLDRLSDPVGQYAALAAFLPNQIEEPPAAAPTPEELLASHLDRAAADIPLPVWLLESGHAEQLALPGPPGDADEAA